MGIFPEIIGNVVSSQPKTIKILVDEPETKNPKLDFPNYANKITELIINSIPNFTVGIFGKWGTGKTTLMKLIQNQINAKNVLSIWFNPWRYERENTLATIPLILTIIGSLYNELDKRKSLDKLSETKRETLGSRLRRIFSGLSIDATFGFPGIANIDINYDVSKVAQSHDDQNEDNRKQIAIQKTTVQEGLDAITESLKQLSPDDEKLKLVVFIDDLDRCTPEKAVEVLESIKIFLNIDGIVFVLALSKEIIVMAINENNKFFKEKYSGDDYLKKIIQLPVLIPRWSEGDISEYLNFLLDSYADENYRGIFKASDNFSLILQAVEPNPREVKRFLNTFILANEISGFTTDKERTEFLAIQAILFRWEWLYEIIYGNREDLNKINRLLFKSDSKEFGKLKDGSFEKWVMVDPQLVNFLKGRGEIIFEIPDDRLKRYRRAAAASSVLSSGQEKNVSTSTISFRPGVKFQPLPNPSGLSPYHLSLDSILSANEIKSIEKSGGISFHTIGNTGGIKNPEPQHRIANAMASELNSINSFKPAFLYLLGDLVYYFGKSSEYYPQFYQPYAYYSAPIFSIPGNHDGDVPLGDETPSLAAYAKNFCAKSSERSPDASDIPRATMIQPNVYWTLEAPFVTLVGLYSNVPEGGMFEQDQIDWFTSELKTAPKNKALIVAVHHPPFSAATNSGGSKPLGQMLDNAFEKSGRIADLVLTAHITNYQRFTRLFKKRHIPYLVVGAGGYHNLARIRTLPNGRIIKVPYKMGSMILENYYNENHGYLSLRVTSGSIIGTYSTVLNGKSGNFSIQKIDNFELDLQRHKLKNKVK